MTWMDTPKSRGTTYQRPNDGECAVCGGSWSGRWTDNGEPVYEGGTLHVIRDGAPYVYRCRCFAAKRKYPAVPGNLWQRFVTEGREIRDDS